MAEKKATSKAKPAAKSAPKAAATKVKAPAPKKAETPKPAPAKAPRVRKPKAEGATSTPSRTSTRKVRQGIVVSTKMDKTVVVKIERRTQHPIYGKVVIRSNKFKAHDLVGCDEGDLVEIMETRPISRDKRWRVTQILEKVK